MDLLLYLFLEAETVLVSVMVAEESITNQLIVWIDILHSDLLCTAF
jgi:hypothetical protein